MSNDVSASIPALQVGESSKRAAVIDDAFDDVIEGEITFSSFKKFHQSANQDDELNKVLVRLQIEHPEIEDWDDDSPQYFEFLKALWENRNDQELYRLINTPELFFNKIEKLNGLEVLCRNIEAQNITVEKFKSKVEDLSLFEQGEFLYIFIDYRLGVRNDNDAIANAKNVAKQIYDRCPKEKRPVTILMSADPNVNDRVKEEFKTELMLEGVFRFSPKSELEDTNKVSLIIRAYNEEFASNHKLQEYIHSLVEAAKQAQKEFEQDVTSLNIEDYEYIHNSVLQEQQQPLGDYLGWLYGSHWANLLFRSKELIEKQQILDEVLSQKAPLHHGVPSKELANFFMTALFEQGLPEVKYHPWGGAQLPYLHLGDIFTKSGGTDIYLVVNPQCDLERPKEEMKKQSILLIPGEVIPLETELKDATLKTDFFVFEDKKSRIKWNLKYVKSVAYGEFETWYKGEQLERHFRLRLPYALDIQQRFTTSFSRVGLPIAPPLTRNIAIEVIGKRFDDRVETLMGKSDEYAFLPITRETKEAIRLTLKFALDFKAAVIEELNSLKRLKTTYSESIPKKLTAAITKLEEFVTGFDDWFFSNRRIPYPGNVAKVGSTPLLSAILDQKKGEFSANSLFLINVITKVEDEEIQSIIETEDNVPNAQTHFEISTEEVISNDSLNTKI